MALSGKKDPNLGAIRTGTTRGEVELQLGSPVKSVTAPGGKRIDIYEYEIGNEPSAGRAVGHGALDLLTLGLWEVVGTPIEALQGKKYEMTITYSQNDKVEAINTAVVTETPSVASTPLEKESQTKETPPSEMSVEYRLKRMKELLDQKVITEEEYASNRKIIIASLCDAKDTGIKDTNTDRRSNETQKANVDENKSVSKMVEETKNTKQANGIPNDGLFKVDNIESYVADKQNPILVEWNKWVDHSKFQSLASDLKSRIIEEFVKSKYSNTTTDQEKVDSLVSMLKGYEGVDTATAKKP